MTNKQTLLMKPFDETLVNFIDRFLRECLFLLAQANGRASVDFGCKYECWTIELIMPLYLFLFWVVTCLFVPRGFISV